MKTLAERFRERCPDLEIQLRGRELPQVVRRVDDSLVEVGHAWLNALPEGRRRAASSLLDVARQGLDLPEAVRISVPDDQAPAGIVDEGPAFLRGLGRVLVSGLLAVATVAAMVELADTTWWAWIPVGTFAAYVVVELWAAVDRGRRNAAREAASRALRAERGDGRRELNAGSYLDGVLQVLRRVDEALAEEEPPATSFESDAPPPTSPAPGPETPYTPPSS